MPHLRSTTILLATVVVKASVEGPAVRVTGVGNPHLLDSVPSGHFTISVLISPLYTCLLVTAAGVTYVKGLPEQRVMQLMSEHQRLVGRLK